ncbi:hypothetical protein FB451DRAFT_1492389 [Mycena latifolia]|nr:hypothetical protein FB451DRAFT_1492389 [Mycena latifolia]
MISRIKVGCRERCGQDSPTTAKMAALFLYALPTRLLFACHQRTLGDVTIKSHAAALGFTTSDWIWTSTTTPNASVALRKDVTPPLGKSLIASGIIITATNDMVFYVNGEYIGSDTPPHRARFAHRFCVDLLLSYNVFAVRRVHLRFFRRERRCPRHNPAHYSGGTTDTLVSDPSWRVHGGHPVGFEQLSFDDTHGPSQRWRGRTNHPLGVVNIPSNPPAIGLDHAEWIWTDVGPASGNVPAGSRAFRRTFTPAPGQEYTLYINGVAVDSGTSSMVAQHYMVNFVTPTDEIVVAVLATNNGSAPNKAGLIFAMEANMQPSGRVNCTAGAFLLSDILWKSTKGAIPAGFEQPGFDDSAWPVVANEEVYGGSIWGTITIGAPATPITI